jgi:hypothetical protein
VTPTRPSPQSSTSRTPTVSTESLIEIPGSAIPAGLTVTIAPDGHSVLIEADAGTAPHADFESAIEQIGYSNSSENPTVTSNREIEVVAVDDYDLASDPATATIQVKKVNDRPRVDLDDRSTAYGTGFETMFTEGDA